MDQKLHWVLIFYCCCFFNNCLGDGLKVKAKGARNVLRIEFKPREKLEPHETLVFKPKREGKEMLYGSVVWFVPKEKQESGKSTNNSKVKDVIRLRSGTRQTYQRKNKSLDLNETVILKVKNNQDEDGHTYPRNEHVSHTERTSKSIEQNSKPNGDAALKGKIKNASEQGERDNKGRRNLQTRKNNKNGAQNRRLNNGQNRKRNKNRRQNRKGNTENAQKKTDTNEKDEKNERNNNKVTENAKKEEPEHNIQNENLSKNVHNKKEQVRTKLGDPSNNPKSVITNDDASETSSQPSNQETAIIKEIRSQIAEQIENRVVQKIKEAQDTEKIKESISTEDLSETDETKPLTNAEKQKVVKNADLLGLLLAQSDPSLVKVLIDNSSPENLNVFLSHSNITVEELKDIIAY